MVGSEWSEKAGFGKTEIEEWGLVPANRQGPTSRTA